MAGHDGAGVLEPGIPLDAALRQIAQHSHAAGNDAEDNSLRNGHGDAGHQRHEAPKYHRPHQTCDEPFPALLRTRARCQLVPPDFASHQIGEGIVGPHRQEQQKHAGAAPRRRQRHTDNHQSAQQKARVGSTEEAHPHIGDAGPQPEHVPHQEGQQKSQAHQHRAHQTGNVHT